MQRQLLKYYKSEKYWLLYRLWKVICYTVNISLMHMPYQKHTASIPYKFFLFQCIRIMKTELSKKKGNKTLTHNVLTEFLYFKNKKKKKDSIALEGKENVLSIIKRLWRLLKFLTKWFPKSRKLCNCSFLILTILL